MFLTSFQADVWCRVTEAILFRHNRKFITRIRWEKHFSDGNVRWLVSLWSESEICQEDTIDYASSVMSYLKASALIDFQRLNDHSSDLISKNRSYTLSYCLGSNENEIEFNAVSLSNSEPSILDPVFFFKEHLISAIRSVFEKDIKIHEIVRDESFRIVSICGDKPLTIKDKKRSSNPVFDKLKSSLLFPIVDSDDYEEFGRSITISSNQGCTSRVEIKANLYQGNGIVFTVKNV